jgi:hypothetical protein
MKLLILPFIFIFIFGCQENALDEVKVKSLKGKSGFTSSIATVQDLLGGKFSFISDINTDEPTFTPRYPNSPSIAEGAIHMYDGYFYQDDIDDTFGQEPYYFSYSDNKSYLISDICPGECDSTMLNGFYDRSDGKLWVVAHTADRNVELLMIEFGSSSPINWYETDYADGVSEIDHDGSLSGLDFRIYVTPKKVFIQSRYAAGQFDLEVFDRDSGTFIDFSATPGHQDLDDVIGDNIKISDLVFTDSYAIFSKINANDLYFYDFAGNTLKEIGDFTQMTDGGVIASGRNISNMNTHTHNGIEYFVMRADNDDGAVSGYSRTFLFDLTNFQYIELDTQTSATTNANMDSSVFVDNKLYLAANDQSISEWMLYQFDLGSFPVTFTSNIYATQIDFINDVGATARDYNVRDLVGVAGYVCFSDNELTETHQTNFCYNTGNGDLYEVRPKEFEGELNNAVKINTPGDFLNYSYSPGTYFKSAQVYANRMYVAMKDGAVFNYNVYELVFSSSGITYRKLADYYPYGQNAFSENEMTLSLEPFGTHLSVAVITDPGPPVDLYGQTYDLADYSFYDFENVSFYVADNKQSFSGVPKVVYSDKNVLIGDYIKSISGTPTPGSLFIVKKGNGRKIYKEGLILPPNPKVKKIGNKYYFTAKLVNSASPNRLSLIEFDLNTEEFVTDVGIYGEVLSLHALGDQLFVSGYNVGDGRYGLYRWIAGSSDTSVCAHDTTLYSTPAKLDDKLYCRSMFNNTLYEIDESGASNIIQASMGIATGIYSHEFNSNPIYEVLTLAYKGYIFYVGEEGSNPDRLMRYDPQNSTYSHIQNAYNSNLSIAGNDLQYYLTKSGELVFLNYFDDAHPSSTTVGTRIYEYDLTNNQLKNEVITQDSVITDNNEIIYHNSFGEIFIFNPSAQDQIVASDFGQGGACSTILDAGKSQSYVTKDNGVIVFYHDESVSTANTLCFYDNNTVINFASWGLNGKDLQLRFDAEVDDFLIFQTIDQAAGPDNGKLIKLNQTTNVVSFLTTFDMPATGFFPLNQVGEAIVFCNEGVGLFDPVEEVGVAITNKYLCDGRGLFIDKSEKKIYLSLLDYINRPLIGYELFSLCYAPGGNCSGRSVSSVLQTRPEIDSVSDFYLNPSSLPANITITGSNFDDIVDVNIGGSQCTALSVTSNAITCTPPSGTAGFKSISLVDSTTEYVFEDQVMYTQALGYTSTTSSNPVPLSVGRGDILYITGNGFLPETTITVDGFACEEMYVIGESKIACKLGSSPDGNVNVVIAGPDGQTISGTETFTTTDPKVTNINLAYGPLGGGNTINLTGVNFDFALGMTISVGGLNCASVSVASATSATCTTPDATSLGYGSYDVITTNADGSYYVLEDGYEFVPPPTVTSVDFDREITDGGNYLTINGTGFRTTGLTNVDIGGNPCSVVSVSDSFTINCYTPSHSTGLKDIVVTNPDNQTATLIDAIDYVDEYVAYNLGGATANSIVSLEDNNRIFLNGTYETTLSRGETYSLTASANDKLEAYNKFYIAGRNGSGSAAQKSNMSWVPVHWKGRDFAIHHYRYSNLKIIVYPLTNGTISFEKNGFLPQTGDGTSVTIGTPIILNATSYGTYQLSLGTGSEEMLVFRYADGSGSDVVDAKPVLPVTDDLIGFGGNTTARIVSNSSTNAVSYNSDNNSIGSLFVNVISGDSISTSGTNYSGAAWRVIADDPYVGASGLADGNGMDSAPFIPTSMMSNSFAVNVTQDWTAFASNQPAVINVTNPDGSNWGTITLQRTSTESNAPYKAYTATSFQAGTIFESATDFQMWYQPDTDTNASADDETILFGWDD